MQDYYASWLHPATGTLSRDTLYIESRTALYCNAAVLFKTKNVKVHEEHPRPQRRVQAQKRGNFYLANLP